MLPFVCCIFDCTLGFPGEGPPWSLFSANIDSLLANKSTMKLRDNFLAFQESRHASSNIKEFQRFAGLCGKAVVHGAPLPLRRDKNGDLRVPHGGVCCVSYDLCSRPFDPACDATGRYQKLFDSQRVQAVWAQVQTKLRALIFNVYLQVGSDNAIIEQNDLILSNIFEIASQFGQIPVMICGDFQKPPLEYEAVQLAVQQQAWCDPLDSYDAEGLPHRPVTYARNSSFDNPDLEHCSSIDGILLNEVLLAALKEIGPVYNFGKPHAPIRAVFDWDVASQEGFVWDKPAKFDLSVVAQLETPLQSVAEELWVDFQQRCDDPDDNLAWDAINDFAVETFVTAGIKFQGRGSKLRGAKPTFVKRVVCPGQSSHDTSSSPKVLALERIHGRIVELRRRVQRPPNNESDRATTMAITRKLIGALRHQHLCVPSDFQCSDASLLVLQKRISHMLQQQHLPEKNARIRKWKNSMRDATKTLNVGRNVYKWISQKTKVDPPNLVVDADGNNVFSPLETINVINSTWDDIFSCNIGHQEPHELLRFVWPYIQNIRRDADIPPLTGHLLHQQTLSRNPLAAGGMDGWATREMQALPLMFFDVVAKFFRDIEDGKRSMPAILSSTKQVMLNKPGNSEPLNKRLIAILPVIAVTYASLRFHNLQKWQAAVMPPQVIGGVKGRHMVDVPLGIRMDADASPLTGQHVAGLKLDKSKAFDRVVIKVAIMLMLACGIPRQLVTFFGSLYHGLHRYTCFGKWISNTPISTPCGVIQGCSLSLIAINLMNLVWGIFMSSFKNLTARSFVDDLYLWGPYSAIEDRKMAYDVSNYWDLLTGQVSNASKCQSWSTGKQGRRKLKEIFPDAKHVVTLECLGSRLMLSQQKRYEWPEEKTGKICRDIAAIRAIPCSRHVTEHILASKIIPQVNFTPHLGPIPKKALDAFHSAIAASLWKRPMMWRSKSLLFALLTKPFRTCPFLSRAYTTVLDVCVFVRNASQ